MIPTLLPLLAYLDTDQPQVPVIWCDWQVRPIAGGANNRVYRARRAQDDVAIKFTIRDARDRAGREHDALVALHRLGRAIAPAPVFLDRSTYAQPVVVQQWLAGPVTQAPPHTDTGWSALIDHLSAIHSVTPDHVAHQLPRAVSTAFSVDEAIDAIQTLLSRIPLSARPARVQRIISRLEACTRPRWPTPAPVLCRSDPATRNFIRRSACWASVDWENSGWGDPAYEIADLLTHPNYLAISDERRDWIVDAYCAVHADTYLRQRIVAYEWLCRCWWIVRCACTLYEVPRGLDTRLVDRPPTWMAETQALQDTYLERALTALS